MKLRHDSEEPSAHDEQQAVQVLNQQIELLHEIPVSIPQPYWANLLVKTSQRIDEASSAKAISISWAARVAVPGVVAILFFFIGLHYYVPELPKKETSVASLMGTLPQDALDSLLVRPEQVGVSLSATEMSSDIFQFSSDQITEYFAAAGNHEVLVETMDDAEVATLLAALDAKKNL